MKSDKPEQPTVLKSQANHKKSLTILLPETEIINDPWTLAAANTATFNTTTKSSIIVRPKLLDEIKTLVSYANEHRLHIYTISQGKNWGFGSKVPVRNADILLDLSQMNTISEYDPKFGTVRCEPGVSFAQLSAFLQAQGNLHFLNTIGGHPGASVIGNLLERGDGIGPYCERAEYACAFEVVLADGTVVNTGYSNIKNSKLGQLCKSSLGPDLQSLFLQSNFGIITKLSIWLQPVPIFFRSYSFSLDEHHSLSKLLEEIRSLYTRRILHSPVTFWNDYKWLSSHPSSPWHLEEQPGLYTRDKIKQISNNYFSWYAFGGIYVDDEQIGRSILQRLFAKIKPHSKAKNPWSQLSSRRIKTLRRWNHFLNLKWLNFDQILKSWYQNILLGQPGSTSLNSLFWRRKPAEDGFKDPNTYGCGILWNAFIIPFDGALIEKIFQDLEDIIFQHQFEPIFSFVCLNDRYVRVFQQLLFDRTDPKQESDALDCHKAVYLYLKQSGCSHSRLDILHMTADEDIYLDQSLHNRIKNALDPNGILAPGKYGLS